jgi:hypothetical protein
MEAVFGLGVDFEVRLLVETVMPGVEFVREISAANLRLQQMN